MAVAALAVAGCDPKGFAPQDTNGDGVVDGNDPGNNGPNLRVQSFTLDPDQPIAGEPFTVTAVIVNDGDQSAGPFDWSVSVYWNGDGQFSQDAIGITLAPGATSTLSDGGTYPERHGWDGYVHIDLLDKVNETDEDDNGDHIEWDVIAAPAG